MANSINKHGLSRNLPAKVARAVRQRSKFGCVRCRSGLYQYEHIDPPFESAISHDPEKICCLCGGCHDLVTRGHLSKAAVKELYLKIQQTSPHEVPVPTGPLDFHDGKAELLIGGITYRQVPTTIVRYHGIDIISVRPGNGIRPAEITATFTDESGNETLRLRQNEWIGALDAWDIEIEGRKLVVRRAARQIALEMQIDAPGRLTINRLDMRFGDSHLLISDKTHAVGRYISESDIFWMHAGVGMINNSPEGIAIELASEAIFKDRYELQKKGGKYLADSFQQTVVGNICGAMFIPYGIAIGTRCGTITLSQMAYGSRPFEKTRDVVFHSPEKLPQYLGTGTLD